MNPNNWQKENSPLFQMGNDTPGPYGPGHASFVEGSNGEYLCIYHATDQMDDGWRNRKARCAQLGSTSSGLPILGLPQGGRNPNERGQIPFVPPSGPDGVKDIFKRIGKKIGNEL